MFISNDYSFQSSAALVQGHPSARPHWGHTQGSVFWEYSQMTECIIVHKKDTHGVQMNA